jgi:hypothetical protein
MPTQNENMNKEKIYAHLIPLHHDHDRCCLVTNAYTKLNHEDEHDQIFLWDLVMCDCHTTMMIRCCLVPTHNEN